MTYKEKYRKIFLRFLKNDNIVLPTASRCFNIVISSIPTTWWIDGMDAHKWLEILSHVLIDDLKVFFKNYYVNLTDDDIVKLKDKILEGSLYTGLSIMNLKYKINKNARFLDYKYRDWLNTEI